MESERWLQEGLRPGFSRPQAEDEGDRHERAEARGHARILGGAAAFRKARSIRRRGFVMVEAMIGLSILTVLGMVLLKLALSILHPRQWVVQQTISDAYMTYERAYAERIPFENLVASDSPWPAYPQKSTTTVEIGRLPAVQPDYPDGVPIYGTVIRTRVADGGNYPTDGGTGTEVTNPAAMKIWKAQSVVTYKVGNRDYVKSRTVLRSQ